MAGEVAADMPDGSASSETMETSILGVEGRRGDSMEGVPVPLLLLIDGSESRQPVCEEAGEGGGMKLVVVVVV